MLRVVRVVVGAAVLAGFILVLGIPANAREPVSEISVLTDQELSGFFGATIIVTSAAPPPPKAYCMSFRECRPNKKYEHCPEEVDPKTGQCSHNLERGYSPETCTTNTTRGVKGKRCNPTTAAGLMICRKVYECIPIREKGKLRLVCRPRREGTIVCTKSTYTTSNPFVCRADLCPRQP
jgi:hypothetical protein